MVVRQRRRAFTLMEILLVMAVAVMLAAIGYPAIDSFYTGIKVEAATDAVRAGWAEAQSHAVSEGRPYRFAIVPGKGNYRYAPDSADYWSGGGPPASEDSDNPSIVVEKSLPKGMIFNHGGQMSPPSGSETSLPDDAVPIGEWVTLAVFLPDGTALDDADVTFRLDDSRPISLHLRSLTGVVSVQYGEEED
jgi:prepilin-type N-terminal cleavage/methylation domain-containing protein